MTDLERLFRHLVATLAATDPARLSQPIPIADIQFGIIPYRTHRRALALDSSEDFEAVLLRLCGGEGALARTEPPEIQARLAQEARSAHPDLRLLRAHGEALVALSSSAVRRALEIDPHAPYAPPAAPAPAAEPSREELDEPVPVEALAPDGARTPHPVDLELEGEHALELELPPAAESLPLDEVRTVMPPVAPGARTTHPAAPMCLYCGGTLPVGRQVNFCPHCGESQTSVRCPECQSEVELGWRHCITCGAAMSDR